MFLRNFVFIITCLGVYSLSAQQTIFDFYEKAPQARWESAVLNANSNALPGTYRRLEFGQNYNAGGSARRERLIMEDGRTHSVLYTHPQWQAAGAIKGFFPHIQRLPANASLTGYFGFGNSGREYSTDGGRFTIWIHYWVNGRERWEKVLNVHKNQTGTLQRINVDLSKYANQKVFFEVRADAGDSPRYDRMCWKDLRVVTGTKATPGNACISGIVKNEMGRKISYDGYLYDQNRKYRQVAVDANGRFVISNLPDGTYELTVAAFQPFEGEEEEDLGKNSGDTLPTLPLGEVKSRFSVTNGVANPSELSLIIRRW